jgi:hypothetical protein
MRFPNKILTSIAIRILNLQSYGETMVQNYYREHKKIANTLYYMQ